MSLLFLKDAVAALSAAHAVPPVVVLYLLYGFNGNLTQVDAFLCGISAKAPWSFHEDRVLGVRLRHGNLGCPSLLTEQRSLSEMDERAAFLSLCADV